MPIYRVPPLSAADMAVITMIDDLRQRLRHDVHAHPQRWTSMLRRNTMARAIQGSNSIEGYHATVDDALAAVDAAAPIDATDATWLEITGYRNALTYILQLSEDNPFEFHPHLLRSLHFMMLQHSLDKLPGRWRPGEVWVVNELTGERVYEGPDPRTVPGLIDELIAFLNAADGCPVVVKAAMAHLNLTMIHPFKDGNGRMARALQTLVLCRDGIVSPIFSSIEEWLGQHTQAYYAILAATGQGAWNPGNDAHGWVQFCLRAHFQQAHTVVQRNVWYGRLYEAVVRLGREHGLHERTLAALFDAALGLKVRSGTYRIEHDLSDVVASRDLKRLSDLGLLVAHGERRGRFYTGAASLRALAQATRPDVLAEDPYQLVGNPEGSVKS